MHSRPFLTVIFLLINKQFFKINSLIIREYQKFLERAEQEKFFLKIFRSKNRFFRYFRPKKGKLRLLGIISGFFLVIFDIKIQWKSAQNSQKIGNFFDFST